MNSGNRSRSSEQILLFPSGRGTFGIASELLRELFEPGPILPVPGAPSFIRGVTAYRGKAVTVVDPDPLLDADSVGENASIALLKKPFEHIGFFLRGKPVMGSVAPEGEGDERADRDEWIVGRRLLGTEKTVSMIRIESLMIFMESKVSGGGGGKAND